MPVRLRPGTRSDAANVAANPSPDADIPHAWAAPPQRAAGSLDH